MFYYNQKLYGEKLRELRKQQNLSQADVSKLAGINKETLRRIEGGKVEPKLETLELLGPIYKTDLHALLIEYRLDNFAVFKKISIRLERKFDNNQLNELKCEFGELRKLLPTIKNKYYRQLIMQMLFFTHAIIQFKTKNETKKALTNFTRAIKLSSPNFTLAKYQEYVYSTMEVRILMNISLLLHKLGDKDKYLELLQFCMEAVDIGSDLFPKICHNLAGAYIRYREYSRALDYINQGINWCLDNNTFNGLSLLYYNKGFCEYNIGNQNYRKSIMKALHLCESFDQPELKEKILYNCVKICGMKDDFPNLVGS